MKKTSIVSILLVFVIGCIPSYKIPIQQGNIITQNDINRIRLGMDKKAVRFVLGTPLIRDAFNQDRWDYIYTLNHGRRKAITKHVSIVFSNGQVINISGDLKPQNDPDAEKSEKTVIVDIKPGAKKKKGIFRRMFSSKKKTAKNKPLKDKSVEEKPAKNKSADEKPAQDKS